MLPVQVIPVAAATEGDGLVFASESESDGSDSVENSSEGIDQIPSSGEQQIMGENPKSDEDEGSASEVRPEGMDNLQPNDDNNSDENGSADELPNDEEEVDLPDSNIARDVDYGFTQKSDTGYAVFFKNDGSDEEEPTPKTISFFSSNGVLSLYTAMPTFQAAQKAVTSFNTEKDGSGTSYTFSSTLKETFSDNANTPTKLYAQWTTVSGGHITYIGTDGMRATGKEYILQDNLSSEATLLGADAFTSGDDTHIIGWATTPNYWNGTTYVPGEKISLQEYPNGLILYSVNGINYITYHYEGIDFGSGNYDYGSMKRTVFYFNDRWGSESSVEQDPSGKLFVGWNSQLDGSGDWINKGKKPSEAPNDLYAQYATYLADGSYCVIQYSQGLASGAEKQILEFSDGKVTLPEQIGGGRSVAYWYTDSSPARYYPAGTPVEVYPREQLRPQPIVAGDLYGIIDGNGGKTPVGSSYSAGACYITSAGTLSLYTFNDMDSFTKDGLAVTGYVGQKTSSVYGFSDNIKAAMEAETGSDHIARFTAQYQEVNGGYIQYMGNGAQTTGNESYYVQDGLDFSNIGEAKYAQNPFVAPAGKSFIGWTVTKEGYGGWINPNDPITATENQILYAQWGKNRITYHTSFMDIPHEDVQLNRPIILGGGGDERYIFEGWNTKPDGSGEWYCAGDSIVDGTILNLYEQRLTAPTTGNYYILRSTSSGLSNGRMAQIVTMQNSTETIILPELEGERQLGWYIDGTQPDMDGKFLNEDPLIHLPGSTLTVNSGDILWVANAHIKAELNQNYSGYTQQRIYYRISSAGGLSLLEAKDVFADNPNATFKGWNTAANGTGETTKYLSNAGVYKLYAQWSTGGSSGPSNPGSNPNINPGGNFSNNGTSPGTATVPVSTNTANGNGAITTAVPTSTISNNTASITITASIAKEIISQTVKNGSESIVIAPEVKGTVTKTVVSIPVATVDEISSKTNARLTVVTPVGTVDVTHQGLFGLSTDAKVVIAVAKIGGEVELSIGSESRPIENIIGGVTLTVPITSISPGVVAMLINDDGTRQVIRKSVAGESSIIIPLNGSAKLEIRDNAKSFEDVTAGDWYKNAVAFVTAHELFNGTGNNTFSPKVSMTRGMLAVVLHNLEYNPENNYFSHYNDVASNAWYADAVAWASAKGIVGGYGNGQFGPDDRITREQLAVMLWRYAGNPVASNKELQFNDADQVSGYAIDAMLWATEKGIINGKGGSILDPGGQATRAEVAQMLMNYMTK